MQYFPLFYDTNDKKLLIVGGGKIALQKLEVLDQFNFQITILSKTILSEILTICTKSGYKTVIKELEVSDLSGYDIIIGATDSADLHKLIKQNIPQNTLFNAVDMPDLCDFIFGSMFEKDGILVTLSSGGKAPSVIKALKESLKNAFPSGIKEIIEKIELIRKSEPAGTDRIEKIKAVTKEWFLNKK